MLNQKYFIKFSKKLNNAFFNIVNTRHLEMKIIRDIGKDERNLFSSFIKKLDELEHIFHDE